MARRRKKNIQLNDSISREIWAIVFLFLGIFLILSLMNNLGEFGKWINLFLVQLFGQGVWLFPLVLFGSSVSLFFSKKFEWSLYSVLGIFFLFFSIQGWIHTSVIEIGSDQTVSEGGGMFGVAASILFRNILGDTGTFVLLSGVFLVGFLLTFQVSLIDILSWIGRTLHRMIAGILEILFHRDDENSGDRNSRKIRKSKNKPDKNPEISGGLVIAPTLFPKTLFFETLPLPLL